MTRRDRYRKLISHLDLKSSNNLEWVLTHLEALDDLTADQVKYRLMKRYNEIRLLQQTIRDVSPKLPPKTVSDL